MLYRPAPIHVGKVDSNRQGHYTYWTLYELSIRKDG